jgi:hypothetical protein
MRARAGGHRVGNKLATSSTLMVFPGRGDQLAQPSVGGSVALILGSVRAVHDRDTDVTPIRLLHLAHLSL